MKRTLFQRTASAVLSLVLLSAISLPVFAASGISNIASKVYSSKDALLNDSSAIDFPKGPNTALTVKDDKAQKFEIKDDQMHIKVDGKWYDYLGIGNIADAQTINNGKTTIEIPAFPTTSVADQNAWTAKYGQLVAAYGNHEHGLAKNAPWYADANNHWKLCAVCQAFVGMNWHHDVDNNGICDECGQEIVYRLVTVKDAQGGKVTASIDKGTVGDRVTLTVTPDAGYHLDSIQVLNDNDSHSPRSCIAIQKGSEYYFILDVWDVEITPVFVKD